MAHSSDTKTHTVTLGTWFPRTSLHLDEIARTFRGERLPHQSNEIASMVANLRFRHIQLEEGAFRTLSAEAFPKVQRREGSPAVELTMTEDGILLLSTHGDTLPRLKELLTACYEKLLSPILESVFRRGMPLPKELANVQAVLPFFDIVRSGSPAEAAAIRRGRQSATSELSHGGITVLPGEALTVIYIERTTSLDATWPDRIVRYLTFFREFESQLHTYLRLHRDIWESIDTIYGSRHLRYRDLGKIRDHLSTQQKTIGFVHARIQQMGDVLAARSHHVHDDQLIDDLREFHLDRFDSLKAAHRYLTHLWQVTGQYVDNTQKLLQLVYEENLRREVVILNTIVFGTLLTGFFGMNIPFPWEERWQFAWPASFLVTVLLGVLAIGGYLLLRVSMLNRRFTIRGQNSRPSPSN